MLAPNPTRLDADSPPSQHPSMAPSPAAKKTSGDDERRTRPTPPFSDDRPPETNQMLDHTADECVSTPEIGNRRRETGSQGHGVNLASRTHPPGPRTLAGPAADIHLVVVRCPPTAANSLAVPSRPSSPSSRGCDGRNTDDTHQTRHNAMYASSSTTEWHTASQWEAHMTSCCAGTKALPDVQSPMTSATCETSAGSPDARRLGGPAGSRSSLGVCMNRRPGNPTRKVGFSLWALEVISEGSGSAPPGSHSFAEGTFCFSVDARQPCGGRRADND